MSTTAEEFLRSFEQLSEPERHQVASEILRRTFVSSADLGEEELAAVYAEFTKADTDLAEEESRITTKELLSEDGE